MTVEEWLGHHIEHLTGCERKTLDEYRRFLKRDIAPRLGKIPLTALTPDHLARWVQHLEAAGNAGKTIQNKHGFVSSALNAAVNSGHITVNPAAGQRLPRTERKEMVFLTKEEYHLLHGCFSDHTSRSSSFSRQRARDSQKPPRCSPRTSTRMPLPSASAGPGSAFRGTATSWGHQRLVGRSGPSASPVASSTLSTSRMSGYLSTLPEIRSGSMAGERTCGIRGWSRPARRG